jgi:hypothetical protein
MKWWTKDGFPRYSEVHGEPPIEGICSACEQPARFEWCTKPEIVDGGEYLSPCCWAPRYAAPPMCSICRRRHGLEVIHACE